VPPMSTPIRKATRGSFDVMSGEYIVPAG
jgi:hypothetical protein